VTPSKKSEPELAGNQTGLVAILLSNLAKATEPDLRARLIAAIARLRAQVDR
jgi:hypothetical protein